MTVKYALTRTEIVRSFFQSLASSPKFLVMILIYAAVLGVFSLVRAGVFAHPVSVRDVVVALAWVPGALAFMLLWLFISGKTTERALTISPDGISTEIGSRKGHVSWSKVKLVTDASRHVLIVGVTGNAFFIPGRAFHGPEEKARFIDQIGHWRSAGNAATDIR